MKQWIVILLLILVTGVIRADVIKPCPVTLPRCQVPAYIPRNQIQAIWWNGYNCAVRGKPPVYAPCKQVFVNGVFVGWSFIQAR